MGRTRAKQVRLGDPTGRRALAVLMHGDSAFAGQGIAAEALNFAGLPGYGIGGTVHVVVNNLIGFTTEPRAYSATRYASDVAKRLPIPTLHVNAEDPEAVVRVAALAADYRAEFASDVVVDLIGYRRYGHSEVDDPTVTQPLLYKKIKSWPVLSKSYAERIGVPAAEAAAMAGAAAGVEAEAIMSASKTSIRVWVLAEDANGAPAIVSYEIEATDQEIDEGDHYLMAIEKAGEAGYESGPAFDEHDPAGRVMLKLDGGESISAQESSPGAPLAQSAQAEGCKASPVCKTVISVTVLHRTDEPIHEFSLQQIAGEISDGDMLGSWSIDSTKEIAADRLHDEQLAVGNDGSFFEHLADDFDDDSDPQGGESAPAPRG